MIKNKDIKNKIVENAYRLGKEYEMKYRGCSQCTLAALQDAFGMVDKAIFKASTGLASGTGLMGDAACSAYSGGALFMGQLIGRDKEDFTTRSSSASGIFDMIKKLHDRFIKEYGSIICLEIQKKIFNRSFNLHNKYEKKLFDKMGAHRDKCTSVVGNGANWAAEIILENNDIFKLDY